MAVFNRVMMAHASVVTDATTSGGWIGWMPAKMIPATTAARPAQRMRLEAVGFMVLSLICARCAPNRGHHAHTYNGSVVRRRRACAGPDRCALPAQSVPPPGGGAPAGLVTRGPPAASGASSRGRHTEPCARRRGRWGAEARPTIPASTPRGAPSRTEGATTAGLRPLRALPAPTPGG